MASLDINKLIQESLVQATQTQTVQEEVVSIDDKIVGALTSLQEMQDDTGKVDLNTFLRAKAGVDQEKRALQYTAANMGDDTGKVGKWDELVTKAKMAKDTAKDAIENMPTSGKVAAGAGIAAGAIGAGLAAKKYLAARKAKK